MRQSRVALALASVLRAIDAAKAEVIELRALRPQARLDVAQALAIGQLRERHRQVLVEAGEPLDLVLAANSARRSDGTSSSGRCSITCANTNLPSFIASPAGPSAAGRIVGRGSRGEVQIDTRAKVRFRIALQALIVAAAINVGTLLLCQDK